MLGASVTCGLANLEGISRRIILNDHPNAAVATATILAAISRSPSRYNEVMPAYRWTSPTWTTTGLIEMFIQLRTLQPTVDRCNWRKQPAAKKTKLLDMPCLFGCKPDIASKGAKSRKYQVPFPSPWPGVQSGEILCARCYSWGNKRNKALRSHPVVQNADAKLRVGQQVRIRHLVRCCHLNGESAKVCAGEDDDERILIDCKDRILRLKRQHLEALDDLDKDAIELRRPPKRKQLHVASE